MFYAFRLRKVAERTENAQLAEAANELAEDWAELAVLASRVKLRTWKLLSDKASYPPTSTDPHAQELLDNMVRNDVT